MVGATLAVDQGRRKADPYRGNPAYPICVCTKASVKVEFALGDNQMGLLSWIVVGAIAGWLAGHLVKGEGFGCLGDIIVGVVGGLLGGFLASRFFNMPDAVNGFNLTSIIVAFLGAVIVVVVIRLLRGGRN